MKKIGFAADEMVKIIDAHFAPLLLYARQWDAASAEDLVQEAFLKLLRHSHKKCCPDNVAAWLFQVVRNGAVSHFRKNKRREKHEQAHSAARITWSEPTQESAIESAELAEMLDQVQSSERRTQSAEFQRAGDFSQQSSWGFIHSLLTGLCASSLII
jgi:RNA polymerase sigma factor (sigma-70 family)